MAQVDSLLKLLIDQGGDELRLELGKSPRMYTSGQPLKFFFPELGAEMYSDLVDELIDKGRRSALGPGERVQIVHDAGALGRFSAELRGVNGAGVRFKKARPAPAAAPPLADPAPAPPTPAAAAPAADQPMSPPAAAPPSAPAWATKDPELGTIDGPLAALLENAADVGASDVHLAQDEPAIMRLDGRLTMMTPAPQDMAVLLAQLLTPAARAGLARGVAADAAFSTPNGTRYRANVFQCDGGLAAAFRVLRRHAPDLSTLNLPVSLDWLLEAPHGLILLTGPTGSGKSTTLAALIRRAMEVRPGMVITLEDPIEYTFVAKPGQSLVRQREVGRHVRDFPTGLRDALREDPDILLVGEMRDADSIQLALTAAETGHLVLSSMHTRDAASAVQRILDAMPAARQAQVRGQLADSLRAVIAQRLVPRASGTGRVPATEILTVTHGVAHQIREGKTAALTSAIQTGKDHGMLHLDRCLEAMVDRGLISSRARDRELGLQKR